MSTITRINIDPHFTQGKKYIELDWGDDGKPVGWDERPDCITILGDEELKKRGTAKLVYILRRVTAVIHDIKSNFALPMGLCPCGCLHIVTLYNFNPAEKYEAYRDRIKVVLSTRPKLKERKTRENKRARTTRKVQRGRMNH